MHQAKLQVLVVADQALCREGLLALGEQCAELQMAAARSDEALELLRCRAFDAALVDVGRSLAPGLRLSRWSSAHGGSPRIMLLDDCFHPVRLAAALPAGIDGYWTKHARFDELARAITRVARGQQSFCPQACRYLTSSARHLRYDPPANAAPIDRLAPREAQVLALLVQGLSVQQCAERMRLAQSTVDNHKSRLMRKLGVHKTVDMVRLAAHAGLLEIDAWPNAE